MCKPTLNIIDGNFFVHFASHSPVSNLQGPHGEPTGALHVFLRILHSLKNTYRGNQLVVFDGGRASFRYRLYPDYKKRPIKIKTQKDLDIDASREFAFLILDKLLINMGIPSIRIAGEEADDVVYMLVKLLKDKYSIYCSTSDEDYVQMAKLGATVLLYRKNICITNGNFKDKYGFDISGFTLYKSLKGDTSDNIKGVPGIGDVNATKILSKLDVISLETLYEMCYTSDNIKYSSIVDNFKIVKRNMRLMDLEYVEINEEVIKESYKDACTKAKLNLPIVKKLFNDYGLKEVSNMWLPELFKDMEAK